MIARAAAAEVPFAWFTAGASVQLFRYPGAGHLFTDPGTPDHDDQAAALAWQRSLRFLSSL